MDTELHAATLSDLTTAPATACSECQHQRCTSSNSACRVEARQSDPISGKCKFPELACWKSDSFEGESHDGRKQHSTGSEITVQSSLLTRESVDIDAAWSNPYLVFWYANVVPVEMTISAKADGKWTVLATISHQTIGAGIWNLGVVDLSKFERKKAFPLTFLPELTMQRSQIESKRDQCLGSGWYRMSNLCRITRQHRKLLQTGCLVFPG